MENEENVDGATDLMVPYVHMVTGRPRNASNVIETPVGLRQIGE